MHCIANYRIEKYQSKSNYEIIFSQYAFFHARINYKCIFNIAIGFLKLQLFISVNTVVITAKIKNLKEKT